MTPESTERLSHEALDLRSEAMVSFCYGFSNMLASFALAQNNDNLSKICHFITWLR